MTKPFRADYHDPTGYLNMEYDRRIGYFSMTVDHLHDHYELYYLLSGERIYFIKDRSYRVRAGDLVFVDRNAVHKTLDSGRPDHDRLVLYISPELFADLAVPPELAEGMKEPFGWDVPILRLPSPASEAVERMIGDMVNEMIHPQAGSDWAARHRTVELRSSPTGAGIWVRFVRPIRSRFFIRRPRRWSGILTIIIRRL